MASAGLGTAFRHLRDLFAAGSTLGLEDGQLLERYARSNDAAAFEALVGRHGPMVLATCRAVLRNEHDVEDAFQATFLVLAKKAGAIRGSEALGGWLHRVAYRASVRASSEGRERRLREFEAATARREISRPDSDLAALLHEEIDRLPGSLRRAVVLRDLEGLSYEEAAGQLGWTVPSFRHRLADGRRRLKASLARRGAIPSAVVAAPVSKASVVPAGLARAVVALASGATPPAAVALLTHTLLRGMFMTKIKLASAAALAVLALASAGIAAGRFVEAPAPALQPSTRAEPAMPDPAVDEPAGLVEVRGIVLDPTGKPVAGARVRASTRDPVEIATSGPDGRFRLMVLPPDPWIPLADYGGGYPRLAAWAPGFGLGSFNGGLLPGPPGEVTIPLVEDGPPIEGRIIDGDGRPAAGARVRVKVAWVADRMSFADWMARARSGVANSLQGALFGVTPAIDAETDGDGRFQLTGIGRDRVATLLVSGSTIASTEIRVMTSDDPEIRGAGDTSIPPPGKSATPRAEVFHARKFEAVAGPTRPIEGVFRDHDTGRGIEGMPLRAVVLNQPSDLVISTRTDAEGRYRLLGLPAAPAYQVLFEQFPRHVLPYPNTTVRTPADGRNVGPIELDVTLKRGVVIRGRLTDKATGRPVLGDVQAFVLGDNPHMAEYPHYDPIRKTRNRTDEDGRFQVVTPPGRGFLTVRADRDDYVNALGAESIAGYDPKQGVIRTFRGVCGVTFYHLLAGVALDPKAESVTVDLQVDPGRSVDLAVVDPEGRPVEGLKLQGPSPMSYLETQASSSITVRAIHPDRPRRVILYQDDRKLIGSIWLKGDEVGPLTVRLIPWGSAVGRFLDSQGNPLASQQVNRIRGTSPVKAEDEGIFRMTTIDALPVTDKDGRFRVDGLVPGLKYSFSLGAFRKLPGSGDVIVAPSEVKDLGDIKSPLPK